MGAVTMLGVTASALRGGGGFSRHSKVVLIDNVVKAVIRPYRPVPYQVDGDHLGDSTHLEFRWQSDQLRLIAPATGEHPEAGSGDI
jgi:hypothetical protein